jgi:hypothetical protein
VASVAVIAALVAAGAAPAARASSSPAIAGIKVLKGSAYKFAWPFAPFAVAGRIWVTNLDANRVTILNPTTGAVAKVLNPGSYHLWSAPTALAVQGNNVWTLGFKSGYALSYLVELNGVTGAVVRAINVGTSHNLNSEHAMVVSGGFLWIGTNVLSEFNLTTGRFVRSIVNHAIAPAAITVTSGHVWMVDVSGSLSEFNATTGAFMRQVTLPGAGAAIGGYPPVELALTGTSLWVPTGSLVFEVSTATGAVVRLHTSSWGLNKAMATVAAGGHVWIVSFGSNEVVEVSASTSTLVKTETGAPYDFNYPWGAVVADGHVWVANSSQALGTSDPGSVTVFPAT